jgi:hypothetical protein
VLRVRFVMRKKGKNKKRAGRLNNEQAVFS